MSVDLIIKIVGIGLIVAVSEQLLSKAGKSEFALLVTLIGIVVVLSILIPQVAELFDMLRTTFGI